VRTWQWGDSYELGGLVLGLVLAGVLAAVGVQIGLVLLLGGVLIAGYLWRQRPWLG
jgi:hypothetical protein